MNPDYVLDANVLFNAFISGKDIYSLLFSHRTFYVPDFAFLEIDKYKNRILQKTKLQESEFQAFTLGLLKHIVVVPNLLISNASLMEARNLCESIDEKDSVYVALAIQFDVPLVTNDRQLLTGLREKAFQNILPLSYLIDHYKELTQ